MKKETVLLTVLVCVLLLVNTLFLVIVQISKADYSIGEGPSVQGKLIQGVLAKNDPVKLFEPEVLVKFAPKQVEEKDGSTFDKEEITNKRIIKTSEGEKIVLDYNTKTIIYKGREIPAIVDPIKDEQENIIDFPITNKNEKIGTTLISFERFNIIIDTDYYNSYKQDLDLFFDNFAQRFNLLEATTKWSSEKFFDGDKLNITIIPVESGCWGGEAYPANSIIYLSDPFLKTSCQKPFYNEFNGSPQYGNNGGLGDDWYYMSGFIHESLHSINPLPIYARLWLTEGFSQYNQYNILSDYGDINQETADTYTYLGIPGYRWEEYSNNDYKDTTINNEEIQNSAGYSITSWMLTMSRNPTYDNFFGGGGYLKPLDWNNFYDIIDNNRETIYATMGQEYVKKDAQIIDIIARASNMTFSEVKDIWEYDGPEGPGWGVRQWVDTSWYADLSVNVDVSKSSSPHAGESVQINATITNSGNVSLENVSVRFYNGAEMIHQEYVDVAEQSSVVVSTDFAAEAGEYPIRVVVDEDNLKLESNENNNEANTTINFLPVMCGDVNSDDTVNILDILYLIDYKFKEGEAPLCDPMEICGDVNNHDGFVNLLDILYLINYKFKDGPEPVCSLTVNKGGVEVGNSDMTLEEVEAYLVEAQK